MGKSTKEPGKPWDAVDGVDKVDVVDEAAIAKAAALAEGAEEASREAEADRLAVALERERALLSQSCNAAAARASLASPGQARLARHLKAGLDLVREMSGHGKSPEWVQWEREFEAMIMEAQDGR